MRSSRAWMLVLPVGLAGAVGCELVSGLTGNAMLGTGGGTGSTAGTGGKVAATSSTSTTGGGSTSSQATGTGGGPACTTTCNSASDCPVPTNQCAAAVCTNGCCTTESQPSGHTCNSGSGSFCDGSGDCVGCVKQTDCQTPTSMCTTVACTGGTCVTGNATAGTGCDDNGGKVCDGAGHCVLCASDADCTGAASGATCCDGGCVDMTSDGANCGACGHDCLGGGCAGSMCQPVVLASGQTGARYIAADGTNVYWTTQGTPSLVNQCAVNNCGGKIIALGSNVNVIAVSPTTVFWSGDASYDYLMACSIGGCSGSPTQLITGNDPFGIAVLPDGAHVVFSNNGYVGKPGTIQMCNPAGGACASTLATGLSFPTLVAADANNAYFTTSTAGDLAQVPLTGGAITTLAANQHPFAIVPSATSVYWTSAAGAVSAVPIGGGNVSTIASGHAVGMAVDSQYVYWADNGPPAIIAKCPLSGCTGGPIKLATLVNGDPLGLAIDAKRVYWVDHGEGTVNWVAK